MASRILAINTGSTSTKVAIYDDYQNLVVKNFLHDYQELSVFPNIFSQTDYRKDLILKFLEEIEINLDSIDIFVGRGGLLRPIKSGTYIINQQMLDDLKSEKYGKHACNLGSVLAYDLAAFYNRPAYTVDPVVVDELSPLARVSGFKEINRRSVFHALNQKATANRYADEIGRNYRDLNLIVAHIGGGITIGYHKNGEVVDVNDGLGGEGPFTPERAGTLPTFPLIDLCYSGRYTKEELKKILVGKSGLYSYIGTSDGIEISKRISDNDEEAKFYLEALGYQIIKEIGSLFFVAHGKIDAILLTGGLIKSSDLANYLSANLPPFIPLKIYPGENEMDSLAYGVMRILEKKEELKHY